MRSGTALLARCAPARGPLAAVLGWSALEAAPALLSGLALAHAVDAFRSGDPGRAFAWLSAPAVAIAVGAWASTRLYGVLAVVVEQVRDDLSTAVLDGELGRIALDGRSRSAPFTQLTDQIDQVRALLSALLRSLRSTVSPLIAAATGLLLLDPGLAAAVAVPVSVSLLLYAALLPRTVRRSRDSAVAEEDLGQEITELFGALPQIRGLGVSRWALDRLTLRAAGAAAADVRLIRQQAVRGLVVAAGAYGPLIGVLLVGARGLHSGRISIGDLIGATTYVLAVSAPALRALFGSSGGWLVHLLVLLDRLAVVATVPAGDPDSRSAGRHADSRALVVAADLSFAYRPTAGPVLSHLDLRLLPGQLLAVAGPSGAGKSTLARLVAGVITPTTGRVSLREGIRVCLLPQEAYVFAGTLRENLVYLAPAPVDDARLRAGLETFGLQALVSRLDEQISAADLDSAQREQVVLARAFLSEAELVILDEATCHLDAAAEFAAESAFLADRRTLIVIAHRLDVTERADQVLWLDGVTAQLGTPAKLLAGCAPYRELAGANRVGLR